jgi:hypothetical protein
MRLNSAAACALAALLLASLFSIALLSRHQFNAGALVVAGDQYTDPARAPRGLPVERHSFRRTYGAAWLLYLPLIAVLDEDSGSRTGRSCARLRNSGCSPRFWVQPHREGRSGSL